MVSKISQYRRIPVYITKKIVKKLYIFKKAVVFDASRLRLMTFLKVQTFELRSFSVTIIFVVHLSVSRVLFIKTSVYFRRIVPP